MLIHLLFTGFTIMASSSQWSTHIKACLGKVCFKHSKRIALDILCIDIGIRSSFLFDYAFVTPCQLDALANIIYKTGLVNHRLAVLSVDDDTFLVDKRALLSKLEQCTPMVIDVSGEIDGPVLLDKSASSRLADIHEMKKHIIHSLKENTDAKSEKEEIFIIDIDLPKHMNRTTSFGLLLSYPVVYWYRTTHLEASNSGHGGNDGNCLSMVPLCVCQLFAKNTSNKATQQTRPVQSCAVENISNGVHMICSFSYPEQFKSHLKDCIECWRSSMKDNFAVQSFLSDCTLVQKTVTLAVVAM